MGYRLHASIPNVEYEDNNLELGKQYNSRWDEFNYTHFGKDDGLGMLIPGIFDDFLRDLKRINREIIENNEEYDLYNIEKLEKMFEFAKEKNYYVYFESY
jgi:hypothetical protein